MNNDMPKTEEYNPIECQGVFSENWFYEENHGGARFGLRLAEKLHAEQSAFQKIEVYQTHSFGKLLLLDDLVMLTERDEFVYHEMITHTPLLSHSNPKSVLIIGGGDCGCVREAQKHPAVERIVQCEIDKRVTDVCAKFYPWVTDAKNDPRVELIFEDGAKYIEDNPATFDVIIIDSTDPVGPAAPLFQSPFYDKVASALKPGGIMSAQTESPHYSSGVIADIYREQRRSFKSVHPYYASIPSYPSGLFTLSMTANHALHPQVQQQSLAEAIEYSCRYYNSEVHRGAFMLPSFVKRATLGEEQFKNFG